MSKDEIIHDLRADKAFLKDRVEFLEERLQMAQTALDLASQEASLSNGTLRQRRYRERHRNVTSNVTRDVTKASQGVTGGPLGGSTTVSSGEDVPTTFQENDEEDVNPLKPPIGDGKRHAVTEPDPDWVAFRETYPKTDRTSWPKAERRWKALSLADRAAALEGARKYRPKPGYEKAADGWILDRRWETVDDAPSGNGNGHGLDEPAGYAGLREWSERHAALGEPA